MKIEDHIGIFENALSKDFCDNMINFFETKSELGGEGLFKVDTYKRRDTSIGLLKYGSYLKSKDKKEFDRVLYQCYTEYRQEYIFEDQDIDTLEFTKKTSPLPISYNNDGYKLQKSSSGGGFCKWHSEYNYYSDTTNDRFLVWMVYLNDVEQGGKTDFKYISLKPTKGTLVLWPAYFTHNHRAALDLKEDKYIMTGWLTWNTGKDK